MEIKIMSLPEAMKFKPQVSAAAIRIQNAVLIEAYPPLEGNYVEVFYYFFDDIYGPFEDYTEITDVEAKEILRDFRKVKDSIDLLVVHCYAGQGRSPAVAQALNDIFELKQDLHVEQYPRFNEYVYRTIWETAKYLSNS